jgi:uncharacterized protein (DUF697 family)/tellurite resistance protein
MSTHANDAQIIIAIAAQAAMADGRRDAAEIQQITEAATRLGLPNAEAMVQQAAAEPGDLTELLRSLSSADARQAAYEVAVAIVNADGMADPAEIAFLERVSSSLGTTQVGTGEMSAVASIASLSSAVIAKPAAEAPSRTPPTAEELEALILDQAILTGALEVLPDKLSNMAILPLQLRLVYQIGQRYGQKLDGNQAKDLAATLGIGVAGQVMESIVRKTLGGLAGGLLGGLMGGASGIAAGAAVSFTATYALGHAAAQYYAQGRTLSVSDLKALFTRFQQEAQTLLPKVQERITSVAKGTNLQSIIGSLRGKP